MPGRFASPLTTLANASREARLGWLCRLLGVCRAWVEEEEPPPLGSEEAGWQGLAATAWIHNLEPVLYRLLAARDGGEEAVPEPLLERWERAYYQTHLLNSELLEAVEEILAAARALGLPATVFKGPVTLARGYGDLGLRPMSDVDLLCRREDLAALAQLAGDRGFQPAGEIAVYHTSLFHPETGAGLELHHGLYDFVRDGRNLLADLLAAPAAVEIDGRTFPAPPLEAALVLDLAHLVNHDFRLNLKPYLDWSAVLWRQRETLDRRRAAGAVTAAGLGQEMDLAEEFVGRRLGLPLPAMPHSYARSEEIDPLAAGAFEFLLFADRDSGPEALREAASRQGAAARLDYLRRLLLPPREHLAALATGLGPVPGYPRLLARHWRQTVGRGLTNLHRRGMATAGGGGSSVKARVFARRRRE